MKLLQWMSCCVASLLLFSACGKKDETAVDGGPNGQYSETVNRLFNERNDVLDHIQLAEGTSKVLTLLDVVNRMRASELGSASAQLQEQLLQRAATLVEHVDAENCVDLAFACVLADNQRYRDAVFAFLRDDVELEPAQWFHLNELFAEDAAFQAILAAQSERFTFQLSDLTRTLRRAYASSISTIPPTHQVAVMSQQVIILSLLLGKDQHANDYAFGVQHLGYVLNRFGRFGELNAGMAYAQMTMEAVVVATRAMMLHDDDSAFTHDCWLYMADWLIHLLQPGRMGVNYGDARRVARQERRGSSMAHVLASIAWLRQDPIAIWALKHQFEGYPMSLAGYGASLYDGLNTKFEPLPYGYFPQAGLLVWRNHWGDNSSGLWIRVGYPADVFDHQDRGHLSFTLNGKPILWDCGMPPSSDEYMDRVYRSFRSHNVLSVDFDAPIRASAPLIVRLLDENRGNVRVDGSDCHQALARWHRDVFWRADEELRIVDDLSFKIGERGHISFQWHLAQAEPVDLVRNKRRFIIETDDVAMVIEANETIIVSQTVANNYSRSNTKESSHTVLLVESVGRPLNLKIITRIIPKID